jgi:hypothetical protein
MWHGLAATDSSSAGGEKDSAGHYRVLRSRGGKARSGGAFIGAKGHVSSGLVHAHPVRRRVFSASAVLAGLAIGIGSHTFVFGSDRGRGVGSHGREGSTSVSPDQ